MSLYARRTGLRLGQIAVDAFLLAWVVAWGLVGRAVQRTVAAMAAPARDTGAATRNVADQVRETADQVGRVPGVGAQLRQPLDAAVLSLGDLIAAADRQVHAIERAATMLGWLVFGIPVIILVVVWLPSRIRFVRRARAAQQFLDSSADLDLFALRAMAAQPMHVIARISDDPVGAWRRGDRAVIEALAAIELRRSGLRPPPPPPAGGG